MLERRAGDVLDAGDHVRECSTSVIAQHLDGDQIDALGDTILARSDRARTVRPMPIPIKVLGPPRDRLPPPSPALKLDVGNIDPRIDHVDIDPAVGIERVRGIRVLCKRRERQRRAVRDPSEAPGRGRLLGHRGVRDVGSWGEERRVGLYGLWSTKGPVGRGRVGDGDVLVALDVGDGRVGADLGQCRVGE
jgi:hypothetical protein